MNIDRLHFNYLPHAIASADFGCVLLVYFGVATSYDGILADTARDTSVTDGAVAALCILLSASALGLYERQYLWRDRLALRTAIALGAALIMLAALSSAATRYAAWDAEAWAAIAILSFVGLLANHVVLGRIASARTVKSRVMAQCAHVELRAIQDIESGARPSAFKLVCAPLVEPAGSQKSLFQFALATRIDEIVVSRSFAESHHADLVACRERGIRITEAYAFIERERRYIAVDSAEALHLVTTPGRNAFSRAVKRGFDIVISLALLVFTCPVMLATMIAIRLVDSGPILFRQARVGQGGAVFELLKFRSMRVDAEADGVARWASANDSRVTAIGGFLRRSRIDELPQLFNILRGEMSLVGPRPERPEFVGKLVAIEPMFGSRHLVPPGVTGWAQVNFPYGASFQENLTKAGYDLYYVKHGSILLDIIITLMTVRVIVMGEGAR